MRLRAAVLKAVVTASFLASVLFVPVGAEPPIDALFAFGDSQVDTGNILAFTTALGIEPPGPPSASPHRTYYNGRFSNGPVAVEYLWELLSGAAPDTARGLQPILTFKGNPANQAVNYAFGGSGTGILDLIPGGLLAPGLLGQVELFRASLRGRPPAKRALYVIATGPNDYDPLGTFLPPQQVVLNILDAAQRLYGLGARNLVIFDLPDLSLFPDGDPNGSLITQVHNQLLGQGLDILSTQHPDLRIIRIHVNELLGQLVALGFQLTTPALDVLFPGPWPFNVPTSRCVVLLPLACQDADFDVVGQLGQPYLFWDFLHPTTDVHQLIGQFVYGEVVD